MFACILILILFLPAALLPYALCTFFSSRELQEMGVQMDNIEVTECVPDANIPSACWGVCI
jgi:hypothetical protein